MNKKRNNLKTTSLGLISAALGVSIAFGSLPINTYAVECATCNKEMQEQKDVKLSKEDEIKQAKEELKKYLETFDESVIENTSIKYENDSVKEEIKKSLKRAKELLEEKDIDDAKLEEIKKIPFKKVNGKKQGLFRDYTHKALVDFEVVGDRNIENPHNHKKYVELKDNKLKIKTSLKELPKSGENDKVFLKINYVTNEDFGNTKLDATTTATPKYKKQELDPKNYTIKPVEDGFEVKIEKLPENTKAVKPIVLLKLANKTYFENGDLVFVNSKESAKEEKSIITKFVIDKDTFTKTVNGKEETVKMDVAPFIQNDRTMLPLRYVAESLGAEVKWDNSTRTASFTKDNLTASIQIDGNKIKLSDGKEFTMDAKPVNKNDRVFVSLTNVSKVFNLTNGDTKDGVSQDIEWDNDSRSVTIIKK